jgi:mono/diheme cytochrome c family protein
MNSWEVRRAKDDQLFNSIRNGVKGTAMPPFALPDAEIQELAAFVRSLNAPAAAVPLPGNPSEGESLFFSRLQCVECHMMRGRGGFLGPDLTTIGATRRASQIREAIVSPNAVATDGYQRLLISDGSGHKLRAIARHISNWSIDAVDRCPGRTGRRPPAPRRRDEERRLTEGIVDARRLRAEAFFRGYR